MLMTCINLFNPKVTSILVKPRDSNSGNSNSESIVYTSVQLFPNNWNANDFFQDFSNHTKLFFGDFQDFCKWISIKIHAFPFVLEFFLIRFTSAIANIGTP